MIDTIVILFLIFGTVGLYFAFGFIRDHYAHGPLSDEEDLQAGHRRFIHGCIAFVGFYFVVMFLTVLAPTRPYVMLTFWAGLAAFLTYYVVMQVRRNDVSAIFFERWIGVLDGRSRNAVAIVLNFIFVAAALYCVVNEFLLLQGRV